MREKPSDIIYDPTSSQYHALTSAFNYFNRKLFGGIVPGCLFSFSPALNTKSYIRSSRWEHTSRKMNVWNVCFTLQFFNQPESDLYSDLVHEMTHLWQYEYGTPSRNGYHNREWSMKMEELGLMPSMTGKPGGKQTGQQMDQYILSGGLFEVTLNDLPFDCRIPLALTEASKMEHRNFFTKMKSKTKYRCEHCEVNIWGKPGLEIICGGCKTSFIAAR